MDISNGCYQHKYLKEDMLIANNGSYCSVSPVSGFYTKFNPATFKILNSYYNLVIPYEFLKG